MFLVFELFFFSSVCKVKFLLLTTTFKLPGVFRYAVGFCVMFARNDANSLHCVVSPLLAIPSKQIKTPRFLLNFCFLCAHKTQNTTNLQHLSN